MRFYIGVTTVGVLIGVITSLLLGNMTLGFIYIMVPGILWFYSASYKRQLLIGNLLVAVCSGLMIIVPLLVESTLLTDYFGEKIYSTAIFSSLYAGVCGYAGVAFFWTMI